jgi:hypothetical protein
MKKGVRRYPWRRQTVSTIATPLLTSYDFQNGIHSIPGYNVLSGTDFWNQYSTPLGSSPSDAIRDPATAAAGLSFFYAFPNDLVRFAIARDASLNLMTFDFANPGALTARTQAVSQLVDATTVNLDEAREARSFFSTGSQISSSLPRCRSIFISACSQTMGKANSPHS